MMNKQVVLIGVVIVIVLSGVILLTAAQGEPGAQDDPTAQQQTIDAVVQQRFTQTAEVAQQIAMTQTVQTQVAATEPPSPPTQTAAFQATVDAAFYQALRATAQVEMAASVAARGLELIVPSNIKRLKAMSDFELPVSDLTRVAFSPDGKLFATGNQAGAVQLWDPASGVEIRRTAGQHVTSITSLAFSPDSALLASISQDGILYMWNTLTGEQTMNIQGDTLVCAAFSPDGRTLVTGGQNGTIKTWDVASGQQIQSFTSGIGTIHNIAFNPGQRPDRDQRGCQHRANLGCHQRHLVIRSALRPRHNRYRLQSRRALADRRRSEFEPLSMGCLDRHTTVGQNCRRR